MPIRDILLIIGVLAMVPLALRKPYVGILLWNGLAFLNPQRFVWGPAQMIPFSLIAAAATFCGMFLSGDRKVLPRGAPVVVLIVFMAWMNITTPGALHPERAWAYWARVMKIDIMVLACIALVTTKRQLLLLIWVVAAALGFFGVKGGIFTLIHGGAYKVWGPEASFIGDNNALAAALVMLIPILRFLQIHEGRRWVRYGLVFAMATCGISILGSYSRGAFLAVGAMIANLVLKSRRRLLVACALALAIPLMLSIMPDKWSERMSTIERPSEDESATSRLISWDVAWHFSLDNPVFGGGFETWSNELFSVYAPTYGRGHSFHSIYFQVLAEQGFPGLFLFLLLWVLTYRTGAKVINIARGDPELKWAADFGAMAQVSLIAYAVGGAFLDLAYFDLPYTILAMLIISKRIVEEDLFSRAIPALKGENMPTTAGEPILTRAFLAK